MEKKTAQKWIERFKKEAAPKIAKEFKPEKIILFGSRVRGNAREEAKYENRVSESGARKTRKAHLMKNGMRKIKIQETERKKNLKSNRKSRKINSIHNKN